MTLDGMYHEEHALPGFVHAAARIHLTLPTSNVKGETPVIFKEAPKAILVVNGCLCVPRTTYAASEI